MRSWLRTVICMILASSTVVRQELPVRSREPARPKTRALRQPVPGLAHRRT
jgi:hypothetical protein